MSKPSIKPPKPQTPSGPVISAFEAVAALKPLSNGDAKPPKWTQMHASRAGLWTGKIPREFAKPLSENGA